MKKILAFLLALVFAIALSACNNKDVAKNDNNSENIVDSLQGEKPPAENLETENSQTENSQIENSQTENSQTENLEQENSTPKNSQSEISQPSETKKESNTPTTTSTQEEVKVDVTNPGQNKPSKNNETKDTTTQTTTPSKENITRERAIEIALEHANLKKANVYDIDAEIDREKMLQFGKWILKQKNMSIRTL